MKKSNRLNTACCIFIAIFLFVGFAFAEDAIFVREDGNVGIGTANPDSKLTVTASEDLGGAALRSENSWFKLFPGTLWQGAFNQIVQAGDNGIIFSGSSGPGTGTFVIAPWAYANSGMRITSEGKVGIGTANLTSELTVNGSITTTGSINIPSSINFSSYGYLYGSSRMHIYSGEYLYLLPASGTCISKAWGGNGNLWVEGDAFVGSTLSVGSWLNVNGNIGYRAGNHSVQMTNANGYLEFLIDGDAYGVSIWTSSRRFKENIEPLDISSETVFSLEPVSFNWIEERGGKEDFGLIAEDVAEIIPELALYDEDGKPFSVKYELVSVLLLQEAKKQQDINADLKDRVSDLEIENKQLKDRLSKIEEALDSMGHKIGKNNRRD